MTEYVPRLPEVPKGVSPTLSNYLRMIRQVLNYMMGRLSTENVSSDFTPPSTVNDDIAVNGSFDFGTTEWTANANCTIASSTGNGFLGDCMQMTATSSSQKNMSSSTVFALQKNKIYRLRGYARLGTAATAQCRLSVYYAGYEEQYAWDEDRVNPFINLNGGWQLLERHFTAPMSGNYKIYAYWWSTESSGTIFWDEISLYETDSHGPEHEHKGYHEIMGDRLKINHSPLNYTKASIGTYATEYNQLGTHLRGIDNALGDGRLVGQDGTVTQYVSTASEFSVFDWSFPLAQWAFEDDDLLQIVAFGQTLQNYQSSDALTAKLYFGATPTVYCADVINLAQDSGYYQWYFNIWIKPYSSEASQDIIAAFFMSQTTGYTTGESGSWESGFYKSGIIRNYAAETLTSAFSVKLTLQHGSADANFYTWIKGYSIILRKAPA